VIKKVSRRLFLKMTALFAFFLSIGKVDYSYASGADATGSMPGGEGGEKMNPGVDEDGLSRVYIASGHSPEENIKEAVRLMGGIEKMIGTDDIVVLKPNAQWWNQGTTNTNNMKGFIEGVLAIKDFRGEIIIAENHHYKELDSRGWTTEERNGDYNLNELVQYFNDAGFANVSKYHWVDGGPNPQPQEGTGGGGQRVPSVSEGDGYVWLKDEIYVSPENRKCMMTCPVFTSPYSGAKIDLKKGVLEGGEYIDKVKLVNFSCLNHHGQSFGVTASIKNLMGVVDLTCGYHGTEPEGFYNVHFVGEMSLLYKSGIGLKYYGKRFGFGSAFGKKMQEMGSWSTQYTGGALGHWMKRVKMPDINILAAEYVGWGGRGRKGPEKRERANTVAISHDPVALDYVGAMHILLPATPEKETFYRNLNNPHKKPFRSFLEECHRQGIGNLDAQKIKIIRSTSQ